jgi:CheY-like chemotaxis protein
MRKLGFDVCTVASNEKDAIELAKSNPPDVVVMDVYLGGTRAGIETARWLREVCGVPVVFVTAHSDGGTLERIHTVLPGAPVLFKPIAKRWLPRYLQLLTKCLGNSDRRVSAIGTKQTNSTAAVMSANDPKQT